MKRVVKRLIKGQVMSLKTSGTKKKATKILQNEMRVDGKWKKKASLQ